MTAVRVGTRVDEDAVLAVWQAAQADRGRRSGGTRAQRLRTALRDPLALLLVADGEDGRPVGALLAGLARDDDGAVVPGLLSLSVLAVDPAAQRTGVGTALLRALTDRYPRVAAWVDDEDDVARAALAGAGFAETGRAREGTLELVSAAQVRGRTGAGEARRPRDGCGRRDDGRP